MIKFQDLLSTIYESLRTQNIPVDRLATHLLSWGAFDPVYEGSQKPVFQAFSEKLQNAGSIEKVLFYIKDYFSFFNYHVIEHIVKKLGTEQDKAGLRNYKEELDRYSKRRVYECLPVFGPVSKTNHVDLVLKVDSLYEQFTLEAVKKFRYRLNGILGVSQGVLRLCRVEEGCFQVMFQVPSFVQQKIFPLSSEQERGLVEEGVIKVTCGNYEFIDKVRMCQTARASGLRGNDGNGKRTGLEWTGLTQNCIKCLFSLGKKLSVLIHSLSCLHSLLSCLSSSR